MPSKVSVVVASYQRAHNLADFVAALSAQDFDQPYEVVIVDNGSTDATRSILSGLNDPRFVTLRIENNRGPVPARNLGWRKTRSDIVAFIDDDCLPAPNWLTTLFQGISNADLAQGRTEPNPAHHSRSGPFSHTRQVEGEYGFYPTSNIAYRRQVLEATGGFDESFFFGGEDTDLGWRARALGFRTTYCDDAIVYHEITPSNFKAKLREQAQWYGLVRVVRRFPELRTRFPKGPFWHPLHGTALLALGGVIATAVNLLGVHNIAAAGLTTLTLIPYVYSRIAVYPQLGHTSTRIAALPLSLMVDLTGLYWCSYSSLQCEK